MKKSVFSLYAAIFVILLAVLIVPCGFIWSINTLFQLNLEYSFENITASLVLIALFGPKSNYSSK